MQEARRSRDNEDDVEHEKCKKQEEIDLMSMT